MRTLPIYVSPMSNAIAEIFQDFRTKGKISPFLIYSLKNSPSRIDFRDRFTLLYVGTVNPLKKSALII
jgi:hypothetical protein